MPSKNFFLFSYFKEDMMGRSNKGYFVIAINYKLNKVGYVNSTKK